MALRRRRHLPDRPLTVRQWAALAMGLAAAAAAACHPRGATDLDRAWHAYQQTYIAPAGYVVDRTRNGGEVTSEGQGYALLRAAWMRDQPAFDRVLQWTDGHLRRPDGLFSWRWSPARGEVIDVNTASDADQEIAFALILAAAAFDRPVYRERARDLLQAIRRGETLRLSGTDWFPSAGNWANAERIVNLSYFVPYAYPYFAEVDADAGWSRVIDTGYGLLDAAARLEGVRLPPDFAALDERGALSLLPASSTLKSEFSSDAMRIYWRIALDCQLHRREAACADPLRKSDVSGLLARDGALFTRYRVDGAPMERTTSMSFYGAALPYLLRRDPAAAAGIRARLGGAVLDDASRDPGHYYDANWIWFGLAAADGVIQQRTPPPGR